MDDAGEVVAPAQDAPKRQSASRRAVPRSVVVLAVILTAAGGFGIGFAAEGRRRVPAIDEQASRTSVATTPAAPTTQTPVETTTSPPETSSTTTSSNSTTTTRPSTTVPVSSTAVPAPTTARAPQPTSAPPTTFSPPRLVAAYAKDGAGNLVIPKAGTSSVTLTNTGGLATQWLLSGTGFTSVGLPQGTLNPGESWTFTVAPGSGAEPVKSGTISVLGPNSLTIAFVVA